MCWPPHEQLPHDVRKITKADLVGIVKPPPESLGCVLYAYRSLGGEVTAVQLEALDRYGRRVTDWPNIARSAKRLTRGRISSSAFFVGGDGDAVAIAEGPTTAMAVGMVLGIPARASGGSTMFGEALLRGSPATAVAAIDRDPAGFARGLLVLEKANKDGVRVRTMCAEEGDVEDDLRRRLAARVSAGDSLVDAWSACIPERSIPSRVPS